MAWLVLVVLFGACGGTGAARTEKTDTGAPAAGIATNGHRGRAVAFTVTGPPIAPRAPACATACPLPYTQTGTAEGSFRGAVAGVGAVQLDGQRFTGATTFVFRGTVASCGDGTVVLRRWEEGALGSAAQLFGSWDIAPGFGTGELANVSGGGVIEAATAKNPGEIASTFRGRVVCRGTATGIETLMKPHAGKRVHFDATTAAPPVSAPVCIEAGKCVVPSTQQSQYRGSLDGTEHAAGAGYTTVTKRGAGFAYAATSLALVTGHIEGCGEGMVVVRSRSEFDGEHVTSTWELVPGFGARALTSASGRGSAKGVREADGTYRTTFRGRIRCP